MHASAQVPPGIIQHIHATHINWISLQPGGSNFFTNMITRIGVVIGIPIMEEDTRLVTISNYLCPEATVVRFSSAAFLWMLVSAPTSHTTPNCVLSPGMNKYIICIPLSVSAFPIHSLDNTITWHLCVLLLWPFPPGLEVLFSIIRHLRDKCKLSYFVLLYQPYQIQL